MKHVSIRVPIYLYKKVETFAESKAMKVSEAIRFILDNHTKEIEESRNVTRLIKNLEAKLAAFADHQRSGNDHGIAAELDRLKKQIQADHKTIKSILMVLGTSDPLAVGKLKELFPHYFK